MIRLKRSVYQVSKICLLNGTEEIAMIPANLDLSVLSNADIDDRSCPDMLYLDIKDIDSLITNLNKSRLIYNYDQQD